MKKVIAYVNAVNGRYYASSPEGEARVLNQGDPIYEGDAVFSQNNGEDGPFIELLYGNGESVTLTDASYYLADAGIAGEQDTGIRTEYDNPVSDEYERLRGRPADASETQTQSESPNSESFYAPDNIPSEIITPPSETLQPPLPEEGEILPPPGPEIRLNIPDSSVTNQPPAGENSAVRGVEDTPYIFTADDFPYTDHEGDTAASIRIYSLPASGTLTYKGIPVTVGTVVPFSEIENGNLVFMPAPDENGESYTTFKFTVSDGGPFGNVPGEMLVHINPIDDPAILTDDEKVMTETGDILTTGGKLDIIDVDNPEEFVPQTDTEGEYGKFSIDKDGNWTFTSYEPYSELNDGDRLTETFTVKGVEGEETTVTVHIDGINDPAVMTDDEKTLTETGDILTTGGKLDITDVDNPAEFVPQTDFVGQYGKFSIDKDGNWTFTSHTPYIELNDGDRLTETFIVKAVDGTETTVVVNIDGVNNPAVVTDDEKTMTETGEILTTGGKLDITDVDNPEEFVPQIDTEGEYGKFSIDKDGNWTFESYTPYSELNDGDRLTDTFIVKAVDGTETTVVVNIDGVNDPAVLTDDEKILTETGEILTTGGKLDITDIDSPAEFVPQTDTEGEYGKFSIDKDGNWTFESYTPYSELNDGDRLTDTFMVKAADGTETTVVVNIDGVNDPAVLTDDEKTLTETGDILTTGGKLDIIDVDNPEEFVPQTDTEGEYGKFSIDKDGNWTFESYTPYSELNDGDRLTDTFIVKAADGTETTVVVHIDGVDDPTAFEGITDQAYTENAPAVILAPDITLADVDSKLQGATVKIENVQDGDVLGFTAVDGVTGTYDPEVGILTFTGEAGADIYKSLLESVTFSSSSEDPTVDDAETVRNITWTVTDEHGNDSTLTSEIAVTPLTDNPVVESGGELNYNSGSPAAPIDSDITLSDVDDTHLDGATVAITDGFSIGDVLNFTDQNGITGSYDPATGILTLTGTATVEQYQEALRSVTFETDGTSFGERTVTWTVTDADSDKAGAGTGSDTSVINVFNPLSTPVPDNVTETVKKDAPYVAITLSATDDVNEITTYKITSLPDNGTLYLDPECTVLVECDTEYPATGEQLVVYFKPDYGNADSPYGVDTCASDDLTFTFQASNSVYGTEFCSDGTATIHVDDVPYAYSAEDKIVTERSYDEANSVVTGNLITDGADHDGGFDYVPAGETGEVYRIKYTDENGDEQTALVGNSVTVTTEYGTLTVYKNGTYEFNYGTLDHNVSDDITVSFDYNIVSGGDVSANWATQNIIIQDGADPQIGTPVDSVLSEAYLPGGTMADDPDAANYTTKTGSLDVTGGSDSFTVKFSDDAIDSLPDDLKSKGVDVTYVRVDDYTIKAVAGGSTVFTVTITDPTDPAAGYEFKLEQPLDGSPDYDFNFEFVVVDKDGDSDSGSFKITVENDSPTEARELETDEDTDLVFTANADATYDNTVIDDGTEGGTKTFITDKGGTVTIEPDGTIKYVPSEDYSGPDSFSYTTDTGSEVKSITVNLTVNPVADAPDWEEKSYATPEDTSVDVFALPLPIITDTDTASYERLGVIDLKPATGTPAVGYEIQKADGTPIFNGSTDTSIKIILVDADGNPRADYHYKDIDTTDAVKLTLEEYQNLVFVPNAQDHRNVTFELKTTSYELNDDGTRNTEEDGAASSASVTVDVQAVTDPVTLSFADDAEQNAVGNEDSWIRLDTLFDFDSDDKTDGSESFKLIVESASLNGWQVNTVGSNTGATTISGGKFELPIGGSSQIWVKPPANNSTDVSNIKATIAAKDSDSDSEHTITTQSDELTFGINVKSVADGVNATVSGSGKEHQNIPFTINTSFIDTKSDGADDMPEVLKSVEIDFSNVPAGYSVHHSDVDGAVGAAVDLTGGKYTHVQDYVQSVSVYTGYFVLVPTNSTASADFNGNIPISVKTTTSQNEDGNIDSVRTANLNIRVEGVVDTRGGDGSGYDLENGSLGFKHDGNFVDKGNSLPDAAIAEDTPYFLNVSVESLEQTAGDNSEKVTLIIKNTGDGSPFGFKIVDAAGNTIGSKQSDGWHLTPEQAAVARVLPDENFSGELNLELKTLVQDMFGSTVDSSYSQTNTLKLTVTPVADDPYIAVREVFTQEDKGIALDIRPIPSDKDGSETAHSVKIAAIPAGAYFMIGGVTVFNAESGSTEVTFTVGETVNGITITAEHLSNIVFYPPKDSNENITLQVTPVIKEQGGDLSDPTLVFPVIVHVQGVADVPVITFNGTEVDVTDDKTDPITLSGTEGGSIPVNITAVSGETSNDGSETISFLLGDVPDNVKLVDAGGNSVGVYMKDSKKWALTAAEMADLRFKPDQSDYSDRIEMTLYTVVTENDGDSRTVELPLVLEIKPEVGADESVIGTARGDEDGLIYLNFNNPADSSEEIVSIKIPVSSIDTDDFTLVVDNGDGTTTPITAAGGYYDISQAYKDGKRVALQVKEGGAWEDKHTAGGEISINGIVIEVIDNNDAADPTYNETDSKTIISDMDIVIDAVADAPEISGEDTVSAIHYNFADLNLSALYPDSDDSEFHYFIIKGDNDGWYLNDAATYNGDGTWYVAKDQLGSVKAAGFHEGTYNLTVVGYSVEKSNEHTATSEKDITFSVTEHEGGSGTWKYADEPILTLTSPTGQEDITEFTLADFILEAKTNDQDGGNEKLSLIIKDLPAGVTIASDIPASISRYIDKDGNPAVRINFDGGTATGLEDIRFVLPEDFSGDFNFSVYAVATEYGNPIGSQPPHSASTGGYQNAEATVTPVADGISASAHGDMAQVLEDVPTQLKIDVQSLDTYTQGSDLPETVSNVRISVVNGSLTDADGGVLAAEGVELAVNIAADGTVTRASDGTIVYVRSKEHSDEPITVNVKADTADVTTGVGSDTAVDQTDSFSIDVRAVPDPAVLTANDTAGDEDTTIALSLAAVFPDMDGSEIHSLKISGIPEGALIVDAGGNPVGMNIGGGEWNITGVDLSDLYIKPSENYSGDMNLKLHAYAIEKSTFEVGESSKDFTVTVNAVADGVVITPHNAEGDRGSYITAGAKGFLEGALIETEQYKQSTGYDPLNPDPSKTDEKYAVTFSGLSEGMSFYDSVNGMTYTPDVNGKITIEGLTQEAFDSLAFKSDIDTGTINITAEVWSQEYKDGHVVDESAKVSALFSVKVNDVPDGFMSPFGASDIFSDNDIDLSGFGSTDSDGADILSSVGLLMSDFLDTDIEDGLRAAFDDDDLSQPSGEDGSDGYGVYAGGDDGLTVKVDVDTTSAVG